MSGLKSDSKISGSISGVQNVRGKVTVPTSTVKYSHWGEIEGNIADQQDLIDLIDLNTGDYDPLRNKPKILGNTLDGDKTFIELGLGEISPQDIDDMFDDLLYGGN